MPILEAAQSYMQNVLGYSPLETGVRFLPSTLVIMVAGPLAGRLADKIGPRTPLVVGLLLVTVSLAWQSRVEVDTSYAFLVTPFILLGVGISGSYIVRQTGVPYPLDFSPSLVITGTGLLAVLIATLAFVPLNGYFLPRGWGIALICAYLSLMIANIVVEIKAESS